MDIQWLLRGNKSFLDFVPDLESSKLDKLFQTDFMRSLTHEYWTHYQRKIIYKALIPWILFSILSLSYFAEVLSQSSETYKLFDSWDALGLVVILLTLYQLYYECKSIRDDAKSYFRSAYNYIDLFQYLGTLLIVFMNVSGLHLPLLIEQRSFCTFLLLSQGCKAVLDWLRLFDKTSFYVTLISKTIVDIVYIAFIIVVILVYCGCAMYMLQQNSGYGESSDIIYPTF